LAQLIDQQDGPKKKVVGQKGYELGAGDLKNRFEALAQGGTQHPCIE